MSDDSTQDDSNNGGEVPPVDKELAERVIALYQGVDQVLDELRVPDDERKEVEKNLMEAIAADLLVRLGGKLSDEERESLAEAGQGATAGADPNLDSVAEFFRGKFSQQELVESLAEATESVLTEFAESMRR